LRYFGPQLDFSAQLRSAKSLAFIECPDIAQNKSDGAVLSCDFFCGLVPDVKIQTGYMKLNESSQHQTGY
jgi:hypothetical protein